MVDGLLRSEFGDGGEDGESVAGQEHDVLGVASDCG